MKPPASAGATPAPRRPAPAKAGGFMGRTGRFGYHAGRMKLPVFDPADDPAAPPWYADGLKFQCTQCGNCCTGGPGYVWVSDPEIDRFAAALDSDRAAFLKKYCRVIDGKISLKERRTPEGLYDCVFLKHIDIEVGGRPGKKRVCSVYDVRPLQCRTWPFWDGLLSEPEAWQGAKKTCPGLDRGRTFTREQIESYRDAEDWPEKSPGST